MTYSNRLGHTKNIKSIVENTNSLLERALSNFKAHSFLWPRSSNSIHSKYSSTVKSQSNLKYTLTDSSAKSRHLVD